MKAWQRFVLSWAWLILLTLVSVSLGQYFQNTAFNALIFISVIMFIVVLKGQQIIDVFMELDHAPRFWRNIMLAYIIVVPAIIVTIYIWSY